MPQKADPTSIAEWRRICQPPSTVGYWSMNVLRKVSIFLSIFFIKLGISPTAITFTRFFIALLGIGLIAVGPYWYVLAGLIVYHLAYLMDLNDGEVFRYRAWKTGRKESVIVGFFLDKAFDQIYRPLLLAAAGIGAWNVFGEPIYLIIGMAGAILISLDHVIKLKLTSALIYKKQTAYLTEEASESGSRYDWIYEFFRINNAFTLYFWFGIVGYLHVFLVGYTVLLFLLVIQTFINQYKATLEVDGRIRRAMRNTH